MPLRLSIETVTDQIFQTGSVRLREDLGIQQLVNPSRSLVVGRVFNADPLGIRYADSALLENILPRLIIKEPPDALAGGNRKLQRLSVIANPRKDGALGASRLLG
jgi:hypothetical protein